MACLRKPLDLLDTEGVGADPVDLLEVQRTPLPPARRVHPRTSPACLAPQAPGHPPRTSRACRRCRRRRRYRPFFYSHAIGSPCRGLTHRPPPPRHQFLDDPASRGSTPEHQVCTERAGQRRLARRSARPRRRPPPDRASRSVATAHSPSEPAPYTSTRPERGRRMAGDRSAKTPRTGRRTPRAHRATLVGYSEQHAVAARPSARRSRR